MVSLEIGTLAIYSVRNLNSFEDHVLVQSAPKIWNYVYVTLIMILMLHSDNWGGLFTFGPLYRPWMAVKPMKHWRVTIFFGKIHLRLQSATRRWLTFLHKYIFGKSRSMTQLKINKVSYLQTAWTNIQIFQFELDQLDLALIRIVYLYTWRSSVHYSTDLSYFTNVSEMNVQWSIWMIGSIT